MTMSLCQGLLNEPTSARWLGSANVPVLIQVPNLTSKPTRSGTRIPTARLRPRKISGSTRPRRRIRRDVRLAGSAVLFSVPVTWALLSFWSPSPLAGAAPPSTTVAASVTASEFPAPAGPTLADAPPVAGPWASISLEPVPDDLSERLGGPAVQPAGYLLPEPSAEDLTHEGG